MSSHKSVCHVKKPSTQFVLVSSLCSLTYTCCPNCSETSWEVMLSPKGHCSTTALKKRERSRRWRERGVLQDHGSNKSAKELNPSSSTATSARGKNDQQPQLNSRALLQRSLLLWKGKSFACTQSLPDVISSPPHLTERFPFSSS